MHPDHADPWSEAHHRILERLAALAALTEAGSRLAARRQERREDTKRRQATDIVGLRGRLQRMQLLDVARTWRTALHNGRDPAAHTVAAAAEADLRRRWPQLMDIYDDARRHGLHPLPAMQAAGLRHAEQLIWAAYPHLKPIYQNARSRGRSAREAMHDAWSSQLATPHGGNSAWTSGPARQPLAAAPAALGRELARIADWLDPATRTQWIHGLPETGADPAAVAWCEQLLTQSGQQIAAAARGAAQPANPSTATTDEHTAGMVAAADQTAAGSIAGSAAGDGGPQAVTAPQLARLSFAQRAELGLTQQNQPGAGKILDGAEAARRFDHRQRTGGRGREGRTR